jgi:hypothetical protein
MAPIGSQVDMYLSALGLMPTDVAADNMAGPGMATSLPPVNFQASYLGDWLSGNRHMMELLEGDVMNWAETPQM